MRVEVHGGSEREIAIKGPPQLQSNCLRSPAEALGVEEALSVESSGAP